MKHYTTDEYLILIESLQESSVNRGYDTPHFNIKGVLSSVPERLLWEKIFDLKKVKAAYPKDRLLKFLHGVPLSKVPLYINSYPELAYWRLRINK